MDVYRSRHGSLPASLQVLTAAFPERAIATDPVSRQAYEYRVVTEWKYELCAVLERESQRDGHRFAAPFWQHGPGRQCYELRQNPVTP